MDRTRLATLVAATALPAALTLAAALAPIAPVATAQPDLPDPPPYVPGEPEAEPGSFDYTYNIIAVGPPAVTDSRGAQISSSVDPAMGATGLPGSRLGNSGPADGPLVTSNSRYGISGGLEPPGIPTPGINVGAGVSALPSTEDAAGRPPATPLEPESAAPTDVAGMPPPLLELPGNPHGTAEGPPLA
ncbi:hypothetical protein [Mycolicibacterium palauense]|uniref:hypothetical protein n=1 Tax=Mycolicibacterium palauense TaxID=2034511 RepID=UPI000BFF0A64|nr:hypothetical protein [Mycolicibacterium palauense]